MSKRKSGPEHNGVKDHSSNNEVVHQRQRKARRRLIQTLALGGGIVSAKLVPSKWTAPAVQSVLLPAHASGSVCILGNPSPVVIVSENSSTDPRMLALNRPAGPVGPGAALEKIADMVIPEAEAGREGDTPFELTGCFWIEFLCSSDRGTLYASAVPLDDDGATTLDAPFESGELGDIAGYCFRVVLGNEGESATLEIGLGCGSLNRPIDLEPNPNCIPLVFDDLGP